MSKQNQFAKRGSLQSTIVFEKKPDEPRSQPSAPLSKLRTAQLNTNQGLVQDGVIMDIGQGAMIEAESPNEGSVTSSAACPSLKSARTTSSSESQSATPATSPASLNRSFRFTAPMCLQHFPRPSNLPRTDNSPTVLEQRYQRRKAQNRTAQRAYRDREKMRLSAALQRVREVERELNDAVDLQKHYQNLYETLFAEYEKLWNEINSFDPSPDTSSDGWMPFSQDMQLSTMPVMDLDPGETESGHG